jgi:hypothetical protein
MRQYREYDLPVKSLKNPVNLTAFPVSNYVQFVGYFKGEITMKIDIYQSASSSQKYLSVQSGADVSRIAVDDPDYAKLIRQKSGVEIGEDSLAADAIRDIDRQGYHLHKVRFAIN